MDAEVEVVFVGREVREVILTPVEVESDEVTSRLRQVQIPVADH